MVRRLLCLAVVASALAVPVDGDAAVLNGGAKRKDTPTAKACWQQVSLSPSCKPTNVQRQWCKNPEFRRNGNASMCWWVERWDNVYGKR